MKLKMCSIALLTLPFCHISFSQQTNQTVVIQKRTPKPSNRAVISQSTNSPSASTNQNTYPMTLSTGRNTTLAVKKPIRQNQVPTYNVDSAIKKKVLSLLKELYGNHFDTYIKGKSSQLKFYSDFYQRCELIKLSEAPAGVKNISTLNIIDKYNPQIYSQINYESFDANQFNVFIHRMNYYEKTDLYYKIYNTNIVLKVNGL